MENDSSVTIASLRQMINFHDSWTHRLPPEILVVVASYLNHDASLVALTHVCHLWRVVLIASPHVWAHLDFANKLRALMFLKRSESVPLRVDLKGAKTPPGVMESLDKMASRVTVLRGEDMSFLANILAHPMPALRTLSISQVVRGREEIPLWSPPFPSLTSLVTSGHSFIGFYAPHLTTFHFTYRSCGRFPDGMGNGLLHFLGSCPLLEVVFLHYGEKYKALDFWTDDTFSLPRLRSFTHDSSYYEYELGLFNRFSLPSTCQVRFVVKASELEGPLDMWTPTLPTIRDPSRLSDTRRISIGFHIPPSGGRSSHIRFKVKLVRSNNTITSFDRRSDTLPNPSDYSPDRSLVFLNKIETSSVETMCFYRFPECDESAMFQITRKHIFQGLQKLHNLKTLILSECDSTLFFDALLPCERWCPTVDTLVIQSDQVSLNFGPGWYDLIDRVQEVARLRSEAGSHLKTLILVFRGTGACSMEGTLRKRRAELEQLRNYVGWLEVVAGDEALTWDINKYFLGDHDSFLFKSNV